jgi:PII-like signaling protein
MEKREALMVRVYLTEQRAKVDSLMKHLVEECDVKGITVWEAVSGVGTTPLRGDSTQSVEGHPVVLEFFDHEDQAKELLERIRGLVAPRHIVMHTVTVLETPNVARPDAS